MKAYHTVFLLALSALLGCARGPAIPALGKEHVLSVRVTEDLSAPTGMVERCYLDEKEITGAVVSHIRKRVRGDGRLRVELPSGSDMHDVHWSVVSDLMAYCRQSGVTVTYYQAGKAVQFHLLCWDGYTGVGCDPSTLEYIFDGEPIGRGQSGADVLASEAIARGAVVLFVWPEKAPTKYSSANACPPWPEGLEALWDRWVSRGIKVVASYSK